MPILTALNQTVPIDTHTWSTVAVEVSANTNVTLVFEISQDGTTWYSTSANEPTTGLTDTGVASGTTGIWFSSVAGIRWFRARVSAVGATPSCTLDIVAAERNNPIATPMSGGGALPAGAATSANQTTEIAKLTSIDNKTPALGAAAKAAATPVTLATDDPLSLSIAAVGATAPANAEQIGGQAGVPGTSAPTATTAGKIKTLWTGLAGEVVTRLVGPDTNDLFPSAAAPADGVANAENSPSIRARVIAFNGTTWDRIRTGINTKVLSATGLTGVLNTFGIGRYTATPLSLADGDYAPVQLDTKASAKVAPTGSDGNVLYPAAAALADATANPTTAGAASYLEGYNGTTWDRIRASVTGVVTGVTGWKNVLPGAQYLATPPSLADTNWSTLVATINGFLKVSQGDLTAGENLTDNTLHVTPKAITSSTGGWTNYNSGASLVGTTGVSIKASAGRLGSIRAVNTNTTTNFYLVICDKASAPVANDVAVAAVAIPALLTAAIKNDGVIDFSAAGGMVFTLGVAYAISTTPQKVTLAGTSDCAVTAQYA